MPISPLPILTENCLLKTDDSGIAAAAANSGTPSAAMGVLSAAAKTMLDVA